MPADNISYTQPRLASEAFDASQFHVTHIVGVERISQPFRFELTVVDIGHEALEVDGSRADGLSIDDIAGARVTIELADDGGELQRKIHGIVSEVDDDLDPVRSEEAAFRVTVVPRFWQASLVKLTEVYLAMSIPEIVVEKLKRLGLDSSCDLRLHETYETREFVTQYEETDLDFIHRITEHLGIGYFFEHDDEGNDRIIFTDHAEGFSPVEPKPVLVNDTGDERDVYGLRLVQRLVPKRYVHHDYNYRNPETELLEQSELGDGHAGGHSEYGGHARTPAEAQRLARVRKERAEATRRRYHGRSDVARLGAGHVFAIDGHPRFDGKEVLVTELHHDGYHPRSFAGGEQARYENRFVGTPADLVFRPEVVTPRPKIAGVLTAIVEPGTTAQLNRIRTASGVKIEFGRVGG